MNGAVASFVGVRGAVHDDGPDIGNNAEGERERARVCVGHRRTKREVEMQGFSNTPIEQFMESVGPVVVFAIIGAILVISLGIAIVVCLFLSGCLKAVPEEHRKQEPGLVWLLLIPCFPVVWNFFVYPKVSESFESYFASVGRTDVGDCGKTLALVYCILVAASAVVGFIPYVNVLNCFLGIANLVLWIIFLVKAAGLKSEIRAA